METMTEISDATAAFIAKARRPRESRDELVCEYERTVQQLDAALTKVTEERDRARELAARLANRIEDIEDQLSVANATDSVPFVASAERLRHREGATT